MRKDLVYTITSGRSGTCFLSELFRLNLPGASVFHERVDFDSFGVHTPDISHLMLFNTVGNVPKVREFWSQKFYYDTSLPEPWYVETSHMLAKAGLIENLDLLEREGHAVHIVLLRRNLFDIFWSLVDRGDFRYLGGHTWLHWLDPRYENRILSPRPFLELDAHWGCALWYVMEVFVRAEFYLLLLAERDGIHIHDVHLEQMADAAGATALLRGFGVPTLEGAVRLPPVLNARDGDSLPDDEKSHAFDFYQSCALDAEALRGLARQYYLGGARLGDGRRRALDGGSVQVDSSPREVSLATLSGFR